METINPDALKALKTSSHVVAARLGISREGCQQAVGIKRKGIVDKLNAHAGFWLAKGESRNVVKYRIC